jgi:hypothetical protein
MSRRKQYRAEFKREALRRANEEGVTAVLVAEETGINARQLRRWREAEQRYTYTTELQSQITEPKTKGISVHLPIGFPYGSFHIMPRRNTTTGTTSHDNVHHHAVPVHDRHPHQLRNSPAS